MASRQEAMALPHHKVQASKAYAPSPGMQAALMGLSQEGAWQSINTQGVRRQSPFCKGKIKPSAFGVWMY